MTTREDIAGGLAEILEEVAGVNPDDVAEEKSFTEDLDVDSLSMVEVVVAAEEKFGVKIPDDEVQNLKTVGDAVSYIIKAQSCSISRPRAGLDATAVRPARDPVEGASSEFGSSGHRSRRHDTARRR